MKFTIWLLVIATIAIGGCGELKSPDTTTTTTFSTTTTTVSSTPIIRLYYTYPTDATQKSKTYDSQNFGSAYSTDGISFTKDSGIRLGPLANLSDPDFFKESSGKWVLFYSKAVSSDPTEASILYKATCTTPNGTFSDDTSFTGGTLGNISSTIKIGNTFYTYVVNNGIKIGVYDPTTNKLTSYGIAISNAVDPSPIQISSGSFKLYYKLSGDTYCSSSTDGLTWGAGSKIFSYAEVPGAVYVNSKIYLYYTNSDASSADNGKTMVTISSDNGSTYSTPQAVSGLHDAACDPNPVNYE